MRQISKFVLVAVVSSALVSAAGMPRAFDVTEFGAMGDGTTLATTAINKAIDTAAAAGGGTVYFPAGTFLSGSIHLKSNVALYLDQGSTILASSNPPDYDRAEPNQWDKFQDYG